MIKNLRVHKRILSFAIAETITLTGLSGCTKKMDCDIEYDHMHKYVSEDGFETYKDSEYEYDSKMHWTHETVKANTEQKQMDQFDLLKIEDNKIALEKATKNDLPYIEYEYRYTKRRFIRVRRHTRVIHYHRKDFTKDSNHQDLTGYVRDVTYQYIGYKIGKDEEGSLQIFSSGLVDNLFDIKDEYPYFKINDYKQKVYSEKYEKAKVKIKK